MRHRIAAVCAMPGCQGLGSRRGGRGGSLVGVAGREGGGCRIKAPLEAGGRVQGFWQRPHQVAGLTPMPTLARLPGWTAAVK
jgi:hypothetical protein